jgi:cell shape-determining protein MreC
LEAENKALKSRIDSKESTEYAQGIPASMISNDPAVRNDGDGDRFARRAVLSTDPQLAADYAKWSGKEIVVDPNGLVRNSISNPLSE